MWSDQNMPQQRNMWTEVWVVNEWELCILQKVSRLKIVSCGSYCVLNQKSTCAVAEHPFSMHNIWLHSIIFKLCMSEKVNKKKKERKKKQINKKWTNWNFTIIFSVWAKKCFNQTPCINKFAWTPINDWKNVHLEFAYSNHCQKYSKVSMKNEWRWIQEQNHEQILVNAQKHSLCAYSILARLDSVLIKATLLKHTYKLAENFCTGIVSQMPERVSLLLDKLLICVELQLFVLIFPTFWKLANKFYEINKKIFALVMNLIWQTLLCNFYKSVFAVHAFNSSEAFSWGRSWFRLVNGLIQWERCTIFP